MPIRVRLVNGRYILVDGARRCRAARSAAFTTIAAIVECKDLCRGEITQRQLIANCQRSDLNPIEKSDAVHSLMQETGWNASTAAAKLGFSDSTLSRLLAVRQLPEAIREQVRSGEISLSAAYALKRVDDGAAQSALASEVASGRLTRDALTGSLKAGRKNGESKEAKSPSRVTAKLAPDRAVTVIGESLDLEAFIETLEELLGKARKARTQGVEVGTFIKMLRDQASA